MLFKQAYPPDQGELLIAQEIGRLATPEWCAYHSTFATGWATVRIPVVHSPPGPEQSMREPAEFTVLAPGALLSRMPG